MARKLHEFAGSKGSRRGGEGAPKGKETKEGKEEMLPLEAAFLHVSRDFFQLQTAPFASRLAAIIFKTRIFPSAPGHNEEEVEAKGWKAGRDNGGRYEEINPPLARHPSRPATPPLCPLDLPSLWRPPCSTNPLCSDRGCSRAFSLIMSLAPSVKGLRLPFLR